MVVNTLDNSKIIILMEKAFINGLMAEYLKENGKITKCMAKECSLG